MRRNLLGVLMGVALSVCAAVALAEDKKITEAKGGEVGEIRLRTMAPITYVYVETETTFDKLGQAIEATMPKLAKAAEDGKLKLVPPFVLAYPSGSAHLTPEKAFKVQIGLRVEGEAADVGEVKVRKTQDFRAATAIYTGPPAGMGECYQKLIPAILQNGLELSGEEREFTFYWEGMESPNNIVLVQMGVKGGPRADAAQGQGGVARLLRALAPSGSSKPEAVEVAVVAQPGRAAANAEPVRADKPIELDVLNALVGVWESSFTEKRGTDAEPAKKSGRIEIKWVLGGRYLHMEATSSDGIGSQTVIGFDQAKGQFHRWMFNSRYGSSDSWGTFDQKNKTFNWKGELPNGATTSLIDRAIDKDGRGWTMVVKNRDGQTITEMNGTSRRLKAAAPTVNLEIAAIEPTPELKVLDRYAGSWEGKITLKQSPWTPQEVKQSDAASFQWVLGMRFMRIDASSPDGGEGLHFMGYDTTRGEYRHWFFHSQHEASESAGQWDSQTSTFNWKAAGPPGMSAVMSDKWVNDNQRNWNYLIKDETGKVMFELEATSTRRK